MGDRRDDGTAPTAVRFLPYSYPFRKIRPFIDTKRIRELCKPFYSVDYRPGCPLGDEGTRGRPAGLFKVRQEAYLIGWLLN